VPGVQFATNADGSTSQLRSGAQSANGVNVFIDGVGQKNYVLRGGVSGQTLTRGNPFPQLAIGGSEFRTHAVIAQPREPPWCPLAGCKARPATLRQSAPTAVEVWRPIRSGARDS
jgi:hypothetical protein